MSHTVDNIIIPPNLIVDNAEKVAAKIERFKELGAAGLHVVLDFDRTLTVKRPGSDEEVTTWHIMNEHLPLSAQEQYQQLFAKNRALELSGEMDDSGAVEWWSAILDLFVENNVSLKDVEQTFLERASIRPGTAEVFSSLSSNSIPSTILSAGIRDIIEIWSDKYKISPSLTLSTKLEIDDDSLVVGWNKSSLVHVLNKHEADHPELNTIRSNRPNTIVIGDGLDDAEMASGDENVLRVRILDRRDDDPGVDVEKIRTFERFDALITSGTMQPICDIIQLIVSPQK